MIKATVGIAIFLGLVGVGIAWEVFAFQECLKVGHSTFYCVFSR